MTMPKLTREQRDTAAAALRKMASQATVLAETTDADAQLWNLHPGSVAGVEFPGTTVHGRTADAALERMVLAARRLAEFQLEYAVVLRTRAREVEDGWC